MAEQQHRATIDLSHLSDAEREKILKLFTNPDRFEILEVAQPAKSNHPEIPDSSLVERVADAIVAKATSAGIVNDRPARAAIGVIVGELRAQCWVDAADWLEREAER